MAYNVIKVVELNNETNKYLSILKYAILEKNDNYYLQLKLVNKSEYIIKNFELKYLDNGVEKSFIANNLEVNQGETFFEKNLIALDSDNFTFLDFINIKGKKQNTKKIEKNSKQQDNIGKKKKSYHFMYAWSILITLLSFMGLWFVVADISSSSLGLKSIILDSIWVKFVIFMVLFLFGIGLFITTIVLSNKAKKKGVYDYNNNVKFVVHTLLVMAFSIASMAAIAIIGDHHPSSNNTQSASISNMPVSETPTREWIQVDNIEYPLYVGDTINLDDYVVVYGTENSNMYDAYLDTTDIAIMNGHYLTATGAGTIIVRIVFHDTATFFICDAIYS